MQKLGDGFQDDLNIQIQTPVFYVFCVKTHYILKVRDRASAADLP